MLFVKPKLIFYLVVCGVFYFIYWDFSSCLVENSGNDVGTGRHVEKAFLIRHRNGVGAAVLGDSIITITTGFGFNWLGKQSNHRMEEKGY